MIRQCAWCNRYLGSFTAETFVTHGICEHCAEHIRDSMRPALIEDATPHHEDLLPAADAAPESVLLAN